MWIFERETQRYFCKGLNMKSLSFLILPFVFCALIIFVFVLEHVFDYDFFRLGIYPRTFSGVLGIFFSPFIHGDLEHLISNLSALPVFMGLLTLIHRRNYFTVFSVLYFSTGILVWLFARESYHIGSSGMIYALASFLFFGGIVSGKKGAAAISMITIMLYGSMIWGVLPVVPNVSWESHALGAVAGFFSAFIFVKEQPEKVITDKDFDFKTPGFEKFSLSEDFSKIEYEFKE